MKRHISIFLAAILVLSLLAGCASSGDKSGAGTSDNEGSGTESKTIKVAWTVAYQEDHPYSVAADTFKKVLEEETNGSVKAELYPGGQLGGDRDMFEAIQMGTLDVAINSSPVIAAFTDVLIGVDMPYLFANDYDVLWEAQTGEPGKKLLKRLEEETGVKPLSFVFQPFRHFYTNKEIKSIDDFKGLKLRSMETPIHMAIYSAMGASPTTLPYNDIYSAMQQGTIDGFESDVIGAYTSKFYEVAQNLTVSGHFNNSIVLVASSKLYDSLTPDEQEAIQAAADAAARASMDITVQQNDKYLAEMESKGLTINEIDMDPVYAAVQPVIDKYCAEVPECKEFVEDVEALKAKKGL